MAHARSRPYVVGCWVRCESSSCSLRSRRGAAVQLDPTNYWFSFSGWTYIMHFRTRRSLCDTYFPLRAPRYVSLASFSCCMTGAACRGWIYWNWISWRHNGKVNCAMDAIASVVFSCELCILRAFCTSSLVFVCRCVSARRCPKWSEWKRSRLSNHSEIHPHHLKVKLNLWSNSGQSGDRLVSPNRITPHRQLGQTNFDRFSCHHHNSVCHFLSTFFFAVCSRFIWNCLHIM